MEPVIHRGAPETVHRLGRMVDAVFRPNQRPGEGMPREFPHLFSEQNAHNLYYIEDGGQPVSMVGMLVQEVLFQGISMPVASIGSVGTLPAYEGQRLASRILDRAAADLTDQRIPLMLVSGDRGLYRRAHCTPVGRMFEVEITADLARRMRAGLSAAVDLPAQAQSATETALRAQAVPSAKGELSAAVDPPTQVDLPPESTLQAREIPAGQRASSAGRLLPLYHREPYRYRRTEQEMAVLLNALWFARQDYDQRLFEVADGDTPLSYAVGYARRSEPGTVEIMEYAGSRLACLRTLADILQAFSARVIRFHVHIHDIEMLHLLKTWGVSPRPATLQGTVRVLHEPALFQVLQPLIREQSGVAATVREQGGIWDITLGTTRRICVSPEEVAAWLFNYDEGCLGIPFVHTDDLNYI
ncbi:MAG: GNAT family N-acetyltransferase [Bacilli bacterium]